MRHLLIFFCFIQTALWGADPIGKVVSLQGDVKAGERVLTKGAPIFASEVIAVAPKGKAQIRFTDGGLMNLISDSEFRVDSYRYRQAGQKDRFFASLLKGGFRSLSGSIAKKNAQEYEIQTPSATIGLRGTVIEVSIVGQEVFFGVSEGRAIVSNGVGSQLIGVGEKGQFVYVPSSTTFPELISKRPPQLDLKIFVPAQGGVNIDQLTIRQTGRVGAPEQQPSESPKGGTEGAPRPPESSPPAGPSIGETKDQSEFQFTPTGGGAAIQGGC